MFRSLVESYMTIGLGGRIDFGERPAVVVIDLGKAWTDPRSVIRSKFFKCY